MNLLVKEKTIKLIDELKSTCQIYGMGNDGNEYKIITQVFLYKFINDKFGYEIKKMTDNKFLRHLAGNKIRATPEDSYTGIRCI